LPVAGELKPAAIEPKIAELIHGKGHETSRAGEQYRNRCIRKERDL
jgi:hypothetical protein